PSKAHDDLSPTNSPSSPNSINSSNPVNLTLGPHYNKFKKNIYCGNCGKYGHTYKKCSEPITSLGIVNIKVDVENDIFTRTKEPFKSVDINDKFIPYESEDDLKFFCMF